MTHSFIGAASRPSSPTEQQQFRVVSEEPFVNVIFGFSFKSKTLLYIYHLDDFFFLIFGVEIPLWEPLLRNFRCVSFISDHSIVLVILSMFPYSTTAHLFI